MYEPFLFVVYDWSFDGDIDCLKVLFVLEVWLEFWA